MREGRTADVERAERGLLLLRLLLRLLGLGWLCGCGRVWCWWSWLGWCWLLVVVRLRRAGCSSWRRLPSRGMARGWRWLRHGGSVRVLERCALEPWLAQRERRERCRPRRSRRREPETSERPRSALASTNSTSSSRLQPARTSSSHQAACTPQPAPSTPPWARRPPLLHRLQLPPPTSQNPAGRPLSASSSRATRTSPPSPSRNSPRARRRRLLPSSVRPSLPLPPHLPPATR